MAEAKPIIEQNMNLSLEKAFASMWNLESSLWAHIAENEGYTEYVLSKSFLRAQLGKLTLILRRENIRL